jgi:membrane protein required for beta-lactamase induction
MSTIQAVVMVVSLALLGVGVHDLQSWLERWDHERHFND